MRALFAAVCIFLIAFFIVGSLSTRATRPAIRASLALTCALIAM